MLFCADGFATAQVAAVGLGVRDLQEVGRYGTAIIFPECSADVVTGRAFLGFVEAVRVFKQLPHAVTVFGEHFGHVSLGPPRLAKPPDRVDCVLRPELALVHPLDGARQLRRVIPVEIFGKVEAEFVAEMNRDAEVVEASRGRTWFVSPAEVEHEAAVLLELTVHEPGELGEPRHILRLRFVAVFLLALEREWRAGENEVDAGIGKAREQVEGVAAIRRSPVREVGGRMIFQRHESYVKAVDVKSSTSIMCCG